MGATSASNTIAVIGAGSWGTALAVLLARNGHPTRLWAHRPAHAEAMVRERRNPRYLPDSRFPDNLTAVADLAEALNQIDDLLVAVPSHAFRPTLQAMAPYLEGRHRLSWATKGLEEGTGLLLHQVAASELPEEIPLAVISGPTFASEVVAGLPTALTVASHDEAFGTHLAQSLHGPTLRAYTSTDIIGVEIGGAVKNVLAVAAGIADGLGLGANTRAALITRGLAEVMRLGVALGGQPETFMGLAGLGDLVLTCTDDQSRNRRMGLGLGHGRSIEAVQKEIGQVVEGVRTARVVYQLARSLEVEMPISEQVYRVLYEGLDPRAAAQALLERELKPETG